VAEFVIARNPEEGSSLPYLVRLPIGADGIVLKVRDVWPRAAKVYCHHRRARPRAVRARENRSQFVFAKARGRDVIFWQTARTTRQARPNVALPTQRAGGLILEILVAAVERKSLADLVATMTTGKLRYLLADLAALSHAAVVVEDRYSSVFKLDRVRPAIVAEGLGEAQARYPSVPIVFAETRPLAQEWAYRFLGAALVEHREDHLARVRAAQLPLAGPVPAPEPTTADVRAWAREHGIDVPDRGRLRPEVWAAFRDARP
jgi:ERCC4 domain